MSDNQLTRKIISLFHRNDEDRGSGQQMPSDLSIRSLILTSDPITRSLIIMVAVSVLAALIAFFVYNEVHLFDDYSIISSAESDDMEGTQYAMLGNSVIKYSHDGISCVDTDDQTKWTVAYSMQTPMCDVCGKTMVIAEQQGNQVYVINEKGQLGSFSTSLPIRKACVGSSGVTALVLDDSDITWINMYDTDGEEIITMKTTLEDSGYPLDIAVTSDMKHMVVSYLKAENGNLTSTIAFYDFSSVSDDSDHLKGSFSYTDVVFPQVFYADNSTPVAVGDNCFVVYSGSIASDVETTVSIDREIVGCFHDSDSIGFIFHSEDPDIRYDMEIFSYSGKKVMSTTCDFEYTGVRMEEGEILLYDSRNLNIWRVSGKQKLAVTYEKEVRYFEPVYGLHRYLVITGDSMDKIRIR